jgi:hypothetical protein
LVTTANGAAGRTRRAITASTAGALGVTGALLGTTVAYLATIALFRSELSQRLFPLPYLDIIVVPHAASGNASPIRSAIRRRTGSTSHGLFVTKWFNACSCGPCNRAAIGWIDLRRPSSINPRR